MTATSPFVAESVSGSHHVSSTSGLVGILRSKLETENYWIQNCVKRRCVGIQNCQTTRSAIVLSMDLHMCVHQFGFYVWKHSCVFVWMFSGAPYFFIFCIAYIVHCGQEMRQFLTLVDDSQEEEPRKESIVCLKQLIVTRAAAAHPVAVRIRKRSQRRKRQRNQKKKKERCV